LAESVKNGTKVALNLTDEEIGRADFIKMSQYVDAILCLQFEGVIMDMSAFTEQTWQNALDLVKRKVQLKWTPNTRALLMSKLLRRPLELISQKVDHFLNRTVQPPPTLKYVVYATHDAQVESLMLWLLKD